MEHAVWKFVTKKMRKEKFRLRLRSAMGCIWVPSVLTFCFAVYIDCLLQVLKDTQIGCHIDWIFLGEFIFADDILLCQPVELTFCLQLIHVPSLKFGTNPVSQKSKTQCIICSTQPTSIMNICKIKFEGLPLDWMDKIQHLRIILESDNSMKTVISLKHGKF